MSALNNSPLLGASGSQGYFLQRSVRLRSSASAYFNRTFSVTGNQKIWTWSSWHKICEITNGSILLQQYNDASNQSQMRFGGSASQSRFYDLQGAAFVCDITWTPVYRDPSAWYHVVFVVDTTQATNTDRIKFYINGVQITATASAAWPAQNSNLRFNGNNAHFMNQNGAGSAFGDSYRTEINFVDGQALTPSSFGGYNSGTGVWEPRKYTGTYGTNGFYLNFNDNSAATAAAIGKDSSGNGNNWTPNNISVTAGVTYDSMTDVPTLTSATQSNYAVLNPLNVYGATITNGNLQASTTNISNDATNFSTVQLTSGKWYAEFLLGGSSSNASTGVGVSAGNTTTTYARVGQGTNGMMYKIDGNKESPSGVSAYGATYTYGDLIGVALDLDASPPTITFYKNNTSQGSINLNSGSASTGYVIGCTVRGSAVNFIANFGAGSGFTYTPPTGFKSLNTYNLPAPTIPNGAAYMAATLWTGTGVAQNINNSANGISFQPDLVWVKARSAAYDNQLTDSVRGANKELQSNGTAVESNFGTVTAFNSNGFAVGTGASSNQNGITYVGWQWKESASSGFDIVQQTLATTGINTINHNLNVVPKMVIAKATNVVEQWLVYQSSVTTQSQYLGLNTDAAVATSANLWGSSAFTSSQIYFTGTSGRNYVYYIFSEIAGYSKFGSYVGNGSTDGVFVYTGFRPRFVMVKGSSFVSNWFVIDTSRNPYNVSLNTLRPNLSGAEVTSPTTTYSIDILSNGFKLRTNAADSNTNGATFMYAAFAENPFNYSLAR